MIAKYLTSVVCNFFLAFVDHIGYSFHQNFMKFGPIVHVLMKSGLDLYMGHLGSKTISLGGQIKEKLCVDRTQRL